MRRSWITLAAMLVLVAALGLWLALRPKDTQPAPERLSAIAPEAAGEIQIEWPGKARVELKKENGSWRIVAPHRGRADRLMVERVLSLLAATSELALPATDLERFELDRPKALVTVDGARFALGGINPVTGGVYVRRGERVLLIESRYAAAVPSDPAALNDKRLLAAAEAPVAFTFPQFTVAHRDGKWAVTPADSEVSQDDLLRWIEGWQLAAALRAEPSDAAAPASHITIALRDGRSVPIGVSERDGEFAFTRYDEHMRYYFVAEGARRLLAPPVPSK